MTLHWGSSHIASCLPEDLAARFHEAYADPFLRPDAVTGLPIHNGKTGELIMEMTAEQPVRVSRKKMRNLFSEGIDVQYGKQVERAYVIDDLASHNNGRVKVEFSDGNHAVGDLVIGTDGAKSRLRESIVGFEDAQLTTVPVNLFNFSYKFDAELALRIRQSNKMFINSIHPDHGTMYWLSSTFLALALLPIGPLIRSQSWTSLTLKSRRHGLFKSCRAGTTKPRPLSLTYPPMKGV
jgi:2-polyprenyl-6-methoxyphenol hydroxylase-like FAD-dependent oxidoreductase